MPLRDHFRPPVSSRASWEGFHGQWPAMIVQQLSSVLPDSYMAEPRVHLGPYFEIDATAFEHGRPQTGVAAIDDNGSVATASWNATQQQLSSVLPDSYMAEPRVHLGPYFEIDVTAFEHGRPQTGVAAIDDNGSVATASWNATQPLHQYEYEVLLFDQERDRRLVAAVELVSPANKDRPESRRALVTKCAALLRQGVGIALVDLVTVRRLNLYAELLEWIGQHDPSLGAEPPPTYAAALRFQRPTRRTRLQTWAYPLVVGQPLPTLPLWLSANRSVPLDLEASYEETCRLLRIF